MRKSVRLCSLLYPLYLGQLPPGAKCTKMISLVSILPHCSRSGRQFVHSESHFRPQMTQMTSRELKTNILKDGLLGEQERYRPSACAVQTPESKRNLMLLSLSCQRNERWGSPVWNSVRGR